MNVLVVDADEAFREQIVSALKSMDHETYVASTAEDALEVFFEDTIDIVITALELSDATGLEFLETARGASPGSRVILTADNFSPEDQLAAFALGAVAVLKKPLAADALQIAVTKAGVSLGNKPGTLYKKLGLPDVLQVFLRLKATKTIELVDIGSVQVVDGKVVHAVAGTSVGIEALRQLLSTPNPSLRTSGGDPKSPRTIHGSLDYLLKTLGLPTAPAVYPAPAPVEAPEFESSVPTPDIQALTEAEPIEVPAAVAATPDLSDSYVAELADSMDIRAEALPKSKAAPILIAAAVLLAVVVGAWAMSGDRPKPGKYELVGAPEVKTEPVEATPPPEEEVALPTEQLKLLAGEDDKKNPE